MNMTVVRCEMRREQLFAELLLELQRKLSRAIDFSYPFSELVSRLQPPRIQGYNPLYQAVFNLRPSRPTTHASNTVPYLFDYGRSQNDIGLHLTEANHGDPMVGFLEYNDQMLGREDAAIFARAFEGMAEVLLTTSATSLTVTTLSTKMEPGDHPKMYPL